MAHRIHSLLILKDISTIEELANVSPDVVLQQELSAWVLTLELGNIEDHIIKDY